VSKGLLRIDAAEERTLPGLAPKSFSNAADSGRTLKSVRA
jgi:hypothetical protein